MLRSLNYEVIPFILIANKDIELRKFSISFPSFYWEMKKNKNLGEYTHIDSYNNYRDTNYIYGIP